MSSMRHSLGRPAFAFLVSYPLSDPRRKNYAQSTPSTYTARLRYKESKFSGHATKGTRAGSGSPDSAGPAVRMTAIHGSEWPRPPVDTSRGVCIDHHRVLFLASSRESTAVPVRAGRTGGASATLDAESTAAVRRRACAPKTVGASGVREVAGQQSGEPVHLARRDPVLFWLAEV